jgi:hypothetical protein
LIKTRREIWRWTAQRCPLVSVSTILSRVCVRVGNEGGLLFASAWPTCGVSNMMSVSPRQTLAQMPIIN